MPRESVSFDRAAAFYDQTRAMAPEAAKAVTDAILSQLQRAGADRLLEVGIGTGRITRPLMAHGLAVTGVDIARDMVAQLVAQLTPEHRQPDLIFGDATHLPLRDASFPAVLIVHVLHLVASAENAVAEIHRVLAPGGVLLHKILRDLDVFSESSAWWDDALARHGHPPLRRLRFERLHEIIRESGATAEVIEVARERPWHDPEKVLDILRRRVHSWTWQVDEAVFADCFKEYEPWFREHYPADITEDITHELEIWRWR